MILLTPEGISEGIPEWITEEILKEIPEGTSWSMYFQSDSRKISWRYWTSGVIYDGTLAKIPEGTPGKFFILFFFVKRAESLGEISAKV